MHKREKKQEKNMIKREKTQGNIMKKNTEK